MSYIGATGDFGIANPVFLPAMVFISIRWGSTNFFAVWEGQYWGVWGPSRLHDYRSNLKDTCQFPFYLFTKPFSFVIVHEFLLIYLLGNSQFSFKAHWVPWTMLVTVFFTVLFTALVMLFLCFHFATWVYNQLDRPFGVCPMHSALWHCTLLWLELGIFCFCSSSFFVYLHLV